MTKRIAVYCGASKGSDTKYETEIKRLGRWLAEEEHTLVYGGGKAGLMGVLADEVLACGGQVIGVIPKFLEERELAHTGLTELIFTNDMSSRKQKMLELSDMCIAFPGGPGTLEEIVEAFSWARLGVHTSPCIFYNVFHYYDEMAAMFDRMTEQGFLTSNDREKLFFSDSLEAITKFGREYTPPKIREYNTK